MIRGAPYGNEYTAPIGVRLYNQRVIYYEQPDAPPGANGNYEPRLKHHASHSQYLPAVFGRKKERGKEQRS